MVLYAPMVLGHVDPSMTLVREATRAADHRVRHARRRDPYQQRDAIRVIVECMYEPAGRDHALYQRVARGHGQRVGVPGYRIELAPFGGIKDSGLGYKEGVQEAMKSFVNPKAFSLSWE